MTIQAQLIKAALNDMPKLKAYLWIRSNKQVDGNAIEYLTSGMTEAEILAKLELNRRNEE